MPTVLNAAFFPDAGTFCYLLALEKIGTGKSV